MSEGAFFLLMGRCGACRVLVVMTDPERTPTVAIDPGTGLPPDVGGTDPAAAVWEPLCPGCFRRVQQIRRERGEGPVPAPGGWPQEYQEAARG